MKQKKGFIATSVLYSFFLIFLAFFVILIAIYQNNQIIINRINENAREELDRFLNSNLYSLEVGDKVRFQLNPSASLDLLSEQNRFTVAKVTETSNGKSVLLVADISNPTSVYYTKTGESVAKDHNINIEVFNDLNTRGLYLNNIAYNSNSNVVNPISFSILTTEQIESIKTERESKVSSIFNIDTPMVVKSSTNGNYYILRTYSFNSNISDDIISAYCGGLNNSTNGIGFIRKEIKPSSINGVEYYVPYCAHVSTTEYTHLASDGIVGIDEHMSDLVTDPTALGCTIASGVNGCTSFNGGSTTADQLLIPYTVRIAATIELSNDYVNIDNSILAGRGTESDPYIVYRNN